MKFVKYNIWSFHLYLLWLGVDISSLWVSPFIYITVVQQIWYELYFLNNDSFYTVSHQHTFSPLLETFLIHVYIAGFEILAHLAYGILVYIKNTLFWRFVRETLTFFSSSGLTYHDLQSCYQKRMSFAKLLLDFSKTSLSWQTSKVLDLILVA